ncbi:MAG: ABC transporter permease [Erysipelotrichaceae bacterium]|nr:ABC transporter permease [Erysipelotrichaceae bacterium]
MASIATSAISQGLLWAILAIGIHITYRILDISDLTSEGSFTLGAAVCATAIVNNIPPIMAIFLALISGGLAGMITGLLHTKLQIPSLLAGILSMTGLYSINLRIMGKANIPLNMHDTLLTNIKDLLNLSKDRDAAIFLGIIVCVIVIIFLVWFFNTEFGYAIVATGNNDKMIRANGINSDITKIAGLMLANGLIALSGALVCQYNGYADVQQGIGAIVIGLASVIIGEVIFRNRNFIMSLTGIVIGSIIYRLIVAIVINSNYVSANDMKLFTAIIVAVALYLANVDLKSKRRAKKC